MHTGVFFVLNTYVTATAVTPPVMTAGHFGCSATWARRRKPYRKRCCAVR